MLDFLRNDKIWEYLIILFASAVSTSITIPSILHVARARHLYDDLGHFRKQHDHGIPRLGGVAIFISFIITILIFNVIENKFIPSYLIISAIILFAMGLKDDLSGVNSSTKFLIQIIVCLILVVLGGIRLTSMYGVLGVYDLPYVFSVILSVLVFLLIINAFNLIDGIDGLAAITGILTNTLFSILFFYIHHYELAAISMALVGAIGGFLKFNLTPAKIFMGDAGSLLIGLVSAVMAVELIEFNKAPGIKVISCAPGLMVAILIVPIFDTLRIFFIRITSGTSPFTPDRNHIHHRLLKLGLNHLQCTLTLGCINLIAIAIAILLSNTSNSTIIFIILSTCALLNWLTTFIIRSKEREGVALRNFII